VVSGPLYLCKEAYEQAIQIYGDPTIPAIKFYGNNLDVIGPTGSVTTINLASSSCGTPPSGNWGIADFDGGGGGSVQVGQDLVNGYSGNPPVVVGNSYGPKTGNVINSSDVDSALTTLETNGTVFPIPMFDTASGNGNTASYHISQFAAVKIINHQSTGNNSWITVQIQKSNCHSECSSANNTTPGTITKLRLVH
jgi:hypothetical protein